MPGLETARRDFHDALLVDDPERLYDQAPCGYLSTSPDGTIVKVNQTLLTWTGHARDELLGRRFTDVLPVGDRIYHETHVSPLLHLHGHVREIALEMRRADGGALPVLINAVLDRDAAGDPLVVRIALFDATERRAYERELLHAKRSAESAQARAVELARTLQQTLIPPRLPHVPGLELAAGYRPAGDGSEVGGDFYDVFQVADGEWVVALGDVSGKGVEAAVLTSLVRYSLRGVAVLVPDPSEALAHINGVLFAHDTERFCTMTLLRLTRRGDSWRLLTSTAGHPPSILWRHGGEPVAVGDPGFLVGAFEEPVFTTSELVLGPGDGLVLYTDGVTEARGSDATLFGEARLIEHVAAHGPDPGAVAHGLLDDVLAFQHQHPRDDIALLALRVPR